MSDGIKRFPPEYDATKQYPRQYDLEQIDVYVDAPAGEYFNINGLPENIGFGKHSFTIYVTEPDGQAPLQNLSNVLFEAKDSAGNLIFSGTTNKKDLSGASVCFIWIKEDPLRTIKNIQDGPGTLTIVGQLENVPVAYQESYNLRTTFPLNIRTEFLNNSPILFQSSSKIGSDITINESLEADIDNVNFNKSYANITLKHLETFGGEVETIQVSYLESGSLSVLGDEEYTLLTQQRINKVSGSFEDDIDFRISKGLNPVSQSFRVVMPPMANQSGSDFGLGDNKFKFKFEFLNKNNEKAKDFDSGETLNITSSFVDFVGPATVITGENNLIAGQMYVGNSVGQGLEVSAENSAFLRSIGYLGFTSASAGSGSGFMLYSGSVLAANTDDYSQGGVGFEFVSSSEAFMRFNTNPGIFDVRAKSFFVGSETTQFISGSGENIEISASGFHLTPEGNVTMSGKLAVEAGGTIGGFTISDTALSTDAFILSSSQSTTDPVSFISSSNFKVSAGGQVTASNIFIEGAIITGSTSIDVENDIRVKGVKVAALNINNEIILGDEDAILSASAANISTLEFNNASGSIISASGIRVDGDMVLDGTVTANSFVTNVIEENFSAGNTIFGNSNDDIHQFTGSITIQHTGSSNTGLLLSGSDLRVDGNISSSGDISASSMHANLGFRTGNTKGITFDFNGTNQTQFISANKQFAFYSGSNAEIVFNLDSTDRSPKVGIGTSVPSSTLELSGSDAELLIRTTTGDGRLTFANGGTDKWALGRDNTDNHFKIAEGGALETNTRVTIADGGNVGIGDSDPPQALSVVGNILLQPNDETAAFIHANNKFALSSDSDILIVADSNDTSDLSANDIILGAGSAVNTNTSKDFGFADAYPAGVPRNEFMRIKGDSGNIGIGTSSPSRLLHISSSGVARVKIDGQGGSNARLHFAHGGIDGMNIGFATAGKYFDFYDGSNSFVKFFSGSNSANTLVVSSSKVGIGTAGPAQALDVIGSIRTNENLLFQGAGTHYLKHSGGTAGSDMFTFRFSDNEDVLTIAGDGQVGIGTTSPSEKLEVDGNIKTTGNISSPSFESGFAGSGFRIESGSDGKTSFAVDDLTVRGQMNVFEMLIHQVRATNGSLFVSNTGRIISASLEDASTKQYRLFFDTGSGYGHSFRAGDVIRAQRFTPDVNGSGSADGPASFKSDLVIESVTGISESLARLTGSNGTSDAPVAGYEYVRMGSLSDPDRQGAIYLTADDANAPFIDVADGIKTHAGFNTTGTVKTRLGKLSGITSTRFGTLTGYGFYASGSAFLEGSINSSAGTIGGWGLSATTISSSNIIIDSGNEQILLGSATDITNGAGVFLNGSGHFRAGDGSNKFIKFDGTNALIKSPNFELDSEGKITASAALLSGKLTSTEGAIGGFTINEKSLSTTNFTLSASSEANELFISHSNFKVKNTGQITGSALLLTGSGNTNFLQFNNGVLTIRGDVAASTLSTPSASIDAQGFLTATSGSIGGFEITDTEIKSGSDIQIKADSSMITITDDTFGNTGIQLQHNGGNPRLFAGKQLGEHIKFDGTNTFISSSKFYIGSSEQFISGSNGKLQIRAQDAILSGSSVRIQTDDFFLGGQGSFISGANDQIEITSSQFHLDRDGNATFNGDIKVGSQPSQTNLNDNLVLHYNFDQYNGRQQPGPRFPLRNNVEGELDMIATISTGNGSIEASSGSNAIANTGLFFSGSNRTKTITLDHDTIDASLFNTGNHNFSLSFFFKPVNVARAGNPLQQIFGAGGESNGFNAFITSSKIITNFYEGNKGSVTSASIANNTMYHLVSTYEAGEAKLYLNSELIQTDNISVGTITGFSGKLFLGGFSSNQEYYMSSGSAPIDFNGTHQTYEGYLDEVRVYKNKVLTQNEVRAIFLNPQANVSNTVNGGQIQAGIIKSLNSSATEGTILNLQEGELHAGGSGSSARFLFDGTQLRVSASSFLVGSDSFISGSGDKIEISSSGFHLKPEGDAIFSGSITANDGTIGGWTIGSAQLTNIDSSGGISIDAGNKIITARTGSASDTVRVRFGEINSGQFGIQGEDTDGNIIFNLGEQGNNIGGFTISENELSIDNIKLSSVEKGLVISSSTGIGKVIISSGSLSSTKGSTVNYFVQPSFEELTADTIITASTPTNIGAWYFENDTQSGANTEELWNSGSISMSIADSGAGDGSKHIRINVHREIGPAGTGEGQIPT